MLLIMFKCDRCGLDKQQKISTFQAESELYNFIGTPPDCIESVDNGDLCPKCRQEYKKEKYRAEKLAEAEVNARFWRGEK